MSKLPFLSYPEYKMYLDKKEDMTEEEGQLLEIFLNELSTEELYEPFVNLSTIINPSKSHNKQILAMRDKVAPLKHAQVVSRFRQLKTNRNANPKELEVLVEILKKGNYIR